MKRFITVRQLSIETGVSITTIRNYLNNSNYFEVSDQRPTRINADKLHNGFVCLYDPNWMPVAEFTLQYDISGDDWMRVGPNPDCITLALKQSGQFTQYVHPRRLHDYWNSLQSSSITLLPTMNEFSKKPKPPDRSVRKVMKDAPSVVLVFENHQDRLAWLSNNAPKSLSMGDTPLVVLQQGEFI